MMIDQNEDVWEKLRVPVRPTPVTPVTPERLEETPPEAAEQAIKPETAPADSGNSGRTGVGSDARVRLEASLTRLRGTLTPPDIVRHNRPSLQQVIAHAWYGDWGPQDGPWRLAGKIDAILFGIPLVIIGYSIAWVGERPSRRLCAAPLLSAVAWWLNWIWWF